jgi:methyltransferase
MIFASTNAVYVLLLLVTLQRLAELVIAHRNTKRLMAEGAHEVGSAHYPLIVAVHATWLITLFAWAPIYQSKIDPAWLGVYLALQAARIWVMVSLGRYWTTKIITVPNVPLVKRGPYKYLRHPNYVVVTLEIIVLPLVIGAWPIAVFFSVLNALVLWIRINAENEALHYRS